MATVHASGQPHVVPVTFAVTGTPADTVVTGIDHKPKTTTRLRRLHNITDNPRVSLLCDHFADDWSTLWWVRADGHATVHWSGAPGDEIALLAAKYPQYRTEPPDGPMIVIAIDHWTGWAATRG